MQIIHILFVVLSYLLGAIPFGLVIGRLAGKDVRLEGSKNIGATNVSRVIGKRLGALTLLCDLLKGLLPVFLASSFLPQDEQKLFWICVCGIAAVLGHMYPIYLGFKGGKGVATGLGVFLFLSPWAILVSLVIFVAAVAFTGFVSAGSLLASALIPLWLFLLGKEGTIIFSAIVIALLIWLKHRENIVRLLRGEEKSWRKKKHDQ